MTLVWLIYALFVLGGAGIYLCMPRGGRSTRAAGAILAGGVLMALLALLASRWQDGGEPKGLFLTFGAVALISAGCVITHPKPVYSVIFFVLTVVAVAMMMILQWAEFLAIALIIVYAGAILVTYVFVLMLAQSSVAARYDLRARDPWLGVMSAFLLTGSVAACIGSLPKDSSTSEHRGAVLAAQIETAENSTEADSNAGDSQAFAGPRGNTERVGETLMTRYVVSLELAGVLLLVAMVGAIVLARKRIPPDPFAPPPPKLGEIGRKVEPF